MSERDEGRAAGPPAAEFTPNEYLEDRLALRGRDPVKFMRETTPALRATLAYYERAKAAPSADGCEMERGGGTGG